MFEEQLNTMLTNLANAINTYDEEKEDSPEYHYLCGQYDAVEGIIQLYKESKSK